MENLYDVYFKELQETNNPGKTLTQFYRNLFDIADNKYLQNLRMFNKLIKLYGKEVLFYCIVEMYDIDDLNHENIYPLISYIAKRIADKKAEKYKEISLIDKINDLSKSIEKLKHREFSIRSPFDE